MVTVVTTKVTVYHKTDETLGTITLGGVWTVKQIVEELEKDFKYIAKVVERDTFQVDTEALLELKEKGAN